MGEESNFSRDGFRNDIIQNAHCRLHANSDISLNSIIFYDIYTIDEASRLFDGIERLFSTASAIDQERAERVRAHFQSQNLMSCGSSYNLPLILNKCIYKKSNNFFNHHMEFSRDFSYIKIEIYKPTPTLLVVRIIARLTPESSTKLNQLLYTLHFSYESTARHRGECLIRHSYNPREIKTKEIQEKISSYKLSIISFISRYFTGEFIGRVYENVYPQPSLVPSIMVYSCEHPTNKDEFDVWLKDSFMGLRCFGIQIFSPPHTLAFEHDAYLLFEEVADSGYKNFSIIANPKQIAGKPDEIENEIIYHLEDISFVDFALERFVTCQAIKITKLNSKTSDVMANLTKFKLDDILEIKKQASEYEYIVRRYMIERQMGMTHSFDEDVSFLYRDKPDIELFKTVTEKIDKDAGQLISLCDFIMKQLDSIINIKNLEYSKRNQILTTILAVVVIVLTVIQLLK